MQVNNSYASGELFEYHRTRLRWMNSISDVCDAAGDTIISSLDAQLRISLPTSSCAHLFTDNLPSLGKKKSQTAWVCIEELASVSDLVSSGSF